MSNDSDADTKNNLRRPWTDNEPAPKIRIDVPSEQWLNGKIDQAKRDGRNEYGVPSVSTITAWFTNGSPVLILTEALIKIKGARGEDYNVRQDDLDWLKNSMSKSGLLPLRDNGNEYLPFIQIGYDGEPWINEGNHRIKAAAELGFNYLPVEVRYFDGGERLADKEWTPEALIEAHNKIVVSGTPRISGELGESIDFTVIDTDAMTGDTDDACGLAL